MPAHRLAMYWINRLFECKQTSTQFPNYVALLNDLMARLTWLEQSFAANIQCNAATLCLLDCLSTPLHEVSQLPTYMH
eukprot:scaffold60146_cov38-Prasinocladus_malaysianus.AAC.1